MTFEEFKRKMISRMKDRKFFLREAKENSLSVEEYCSLYFDYMNTTDEDVKEAYQDVCDGEDFISVAESLVMMWSYWMTEPLPKEVLKKNK